jgi:hypothetical protein
MKQADSRGTRRDDKALENLEIMLGPSQFSMTKVKHSTQQMQERVKEQLGEAMAATTEILSFQNKHARLKNPPFVSEEMLIDYPWAPQLVGKFTRDISVDRQQMNSAPYLRRLQALEVVRQSFIRGLEMLESDSFQMGGKQTEGGEKTPRKAAAQGAFKLLRAIMNVEIRMGLGGGLNKMPDRVYSYPPGSKRFEFQSFFKKRGGRGEARGFEWWLKNIGDGYIPFWKKLKQG